LNAKKHKVKIGVFEFSKKNMEKHDECYKKDLETM
jgi:hypothetical protein